MTTHFPGIGAGNGAVGGPPPLPSPSAYGHLMRLPNDPITRQRFEFKDLSRMVREHLTNQMGTESREKAARLLWIQGRPGEGKSEGSLLAALNAGFHVCVASPGLFAGEHEGAPVAALHDLLNGMVHWSGHHQAPVVIQLDDFDLSTANPEDKGATVNSALLVNEMMALADNRHLHRLPMGTNLAFIISVNDARGMRESLTRPGRSIWYEHTPSHEDKANIAWSILDPKTTEERKLVEALVRRHRSQPVAFWQALYFRMRALHSHHLIDRTMPSQAAIDQAFGQRMPLTPAIAWTAAKQLRTSRIRSYLTKTRGLWRRR